MKGLLGSRTNLGAEADCRKGGAEGLQAPVEFQSMRTTSMPSSISALWT